MIEYLSEQKEKYETIEDPSEFVKNIIKELEKDIREVQSDTVHAKKTVKRDREYMEEQHKRGVDAVKKTEQLSSDLFNQRLEFLNSIREHLEKKEISDSERKFFKDFFEKETKDLYPFLSIIQKPQKTEPLSSPTKKRRTNKQNKLTAKNATI